MKSEILTEKFFNRPTLIVARELLGKHLIRRHGGKIEKFIITEVEAYDGFKDKASHASRGKTERNAPMFGKAGRFYIYFTYGMHYMLNIVTGPKNYPAAVLIRGLRDQEADLSGPGKLTKKLKIDKKFNGKIVSPKTGLWIEHNPLIENCKLKIVNSPRIGVLYAGPIWSRKPWRFLLRD